jgi:P4 family phage/plasmid primase-like protien
VRTGREVSAEYLATGEFRADINPRLRNALSEANLVRVSTLVHDADLADWLIARVMDKGRVEKCRTMMDGLAHDPKTGELIPAGQMRSPGKPWLTDRLAVKLMLWSVPQEKLDALLARQRVELLERLGDYYGMPPTVLTTSGYGHHAYYWLPDADGVMSDDGPASGTSARSLNVRAVAAMNEAAGFELFDVKATDAGTRILREVGSENRKGQHPQQVSAVLHQPDLRIDVTDVRFLPAEGPRLGARPRPSSGVLPDDYSGDIRTFDILALFQSRGLHLSAAGGRGHYVRCPWSSVHTTDDGRAWIGEADERWPVFRCKHDSCAGRGTVDIIEHFGADICMSFTAEEFAPRNRGSQKRTSEAEDDAADVGGPLKRGDSVELAAVVWRNLFRGAGVYDLGGMFRYSPSSGAWEEITPAAVRRHVHQYAGRWVESGEDKKGNMRYRPLKLSQQAIESARAAAADAMEAPGFFHKRPRACGFTNGVLMPSGELVEKSPDHRLLLADVLPFRYRPVCELDEITARCPTWARFLGSLFENDADGEEKAVLLMEFIGVAMLGWGTQMERALVCSGPGGCGKSTFGSAVANLFPEEAVCSVALHRLGDRFGKAPLAFSRINIVSDLPSSDIVDSGDLKAIITGDLVEFERKFKDSFSARPRAAHLVLANDLPAVRDRSDGFWARFLVVPFKRRFRGEEDQDRLMAEKLRDEREDTAAACLYHGIKAIRRSRYTIPRSVIAARDEWRTTMNNERMWAREMLRPAAVGSYPTTGDALLVDYRRWCAESGYQPLGKIRFFRELERMGYARKNGRRAAFDCQLTDTTRLYGVA